jgi:hypothetical protein
MKQKDHRKRVKKDGTEKLTVESLDRLLKELSAFASPKPSPVHKSRLAFVSLGILVFFIIALGLKPYGFSVSDNVANTLIVALLSPSLTAIVKK